MFNKNEKLYFIDRIFRNYIDFNYDLQYKLNMEIIFMFKNLGYIQQELVEELKSLIHKAAYDESFGAVSKAQELLCDEFNIPIKRLMVDFS